ncbi:hypothetical protein M201_gp35 [Haloarcula californiae tailed virus 2]|uniref:Uncharacterized protein n=1 Tax=Haloarcula californiae tailed virus 2 TaxID=1273747 RepID=R4THM1_9CAUD|nr:hypothetical protein M201_gp35 [Haloarcula californiae tailed virus 2]AGM11806.1 hypothetical protein HCTV2_35 [Haloarcula californiae tailed virus 2]
MALLDTGVRYAEPTDVERWIRNKSFDANSDPTETQVQQMILEASDEIDKRARRAWRLRERSDLVRLVEWPREVESAFSRRRRRSSRHGFVEPIDKWGTANLDRARVTSIESLEALLPESTEDITANEGRDGDWWVDYRTGTLHIDADVFMVGPIRGSGLIDPARVRVTFRHGEDEQGGTDTEALSQSVPPSIRRATAKLVAADLLDTDQYGSMVASGPEDVPSQGSAASRLREQAYQQVDEYRIKKVF